MIQYSYIMEVRKEMKRVLKAVVCSLLIVAMLAASAPAFAASSIARIMKVNTDYTRLRESADQGSAVITRLRKGTKLLYWGVKDDAMYKVLTSTGKTGYVYGKYLTTYGAMNLKSVYVTKNLTQMYKRSGSSLKKNGVLSKGKYVMVYKTANGWAYVKTMTGKGAYVKTENLKRAF